MTVRSALANRVRTLISKAPDAARDLAGIAGVGLISAGFADIYRPAGLIVAGLFLLVGAFLSTRARG